ncbi:hypothetical protein Nepgr_001362 [Nepenthes gracilis]|uniref:Co-chaperone protein p23 n=1 Tax=Nepenthes gracilis TaxID=150966 RepID=A0AAD3RXI6_NEPGR|nr:hypothetical protein Nepgr_001362 [Nepenthes gracilis]
MSRHPSVKWAQRSDKVFITIELPDAKDIKLKLEPEGKFIFSATKDGTPYVVDLELFDKIDVEESKYNIGLRSIVYAIKKADKKWWSRLIKKEGKPPAFVKVDWDKWVDEEEESATGKRLPDFDDMDFSKLDMGGDDDFDMDESKDEEEEPKENEEDGKEEAASSTTKDEPVELAEEAKA